MNAVLNSASRINMNLLQTYGYGSNSKHNDQQN